MSRTKQCLMSLGLLAVFALYFGYDIYMLKKFLAQADVSSNYFPYRNWFASKLREGIFPLWNPYWGLGKDIQWFLTVPIDIFTPLELIFGPQYHIYQFLQLVIILGSAFYAFIRLGFVPMVSAFGAVLYFMSPWVTYFYFYFFNSHSFVGNVLLSVFAYLWIKTEDSKYLYGIFGAVFFSMFGTKSEFWFFNKSMFIIDVLICAFLFHADNLGKTIKKIGLALASMGVGILAHSWQLDLILNVMKNSARTENKNLSNLVDPEFYRNLFLSILESPLLMGFVIVLLLFLGLSARGWKKWTMVLAGVLEAALSWDIILPELHISPSSPTILGAILGFILSLIVVRDLDWRSQVKTGILYLLLIFYWCRVEPGELGEMQEMHRAPAVVMFVFGALAWLGCREVRSSKLGRLAYGSIFAVFVMRDQGQIVLAYLAGLHWMPSRDNYLIDFPAAIIALLGLQNLLVCIQQSSVRFAARFLPQAVPTVLVLLIMLLPANLYAVHWMMIQSPPDYPYFRGIPDVRNAFRELKDSPLQRILLVNKPTTSFPFGFGESLLEGLNQVTDYSSLVPKNYKEWALYKRTGIPPERKLGVYDYTYTHKTLSRLPKRNDEGMWSGLVYFFNIIARPPLDLNVLRFLGVNYVVMFNKSLGDQTVGGFDLIRPPPGVQLTIPVPEMIQSLQLENIQIVPGGYYLYSEEIAKGKLIYEPETLTIGEVRNPLPRAFFVLDVTNDNDVISDFQNALDVTVEPFNLLKTKSHEFSYRPLTIDKYELEKVVISSNSQQDGYMVLSDLFHPFWQAKIDGVETKVVPAFNIFRAVKTPAGRHSVEFYCEIPYFRFFVCMSILVFTLTVISFFYRGYISDWLANPQAVSR